MKKLGSILAIAVMAFGLTAFVAENTGNQFDFMGDLSKMLACDNCSQVEHDREPPNGIA